MKKVCFLILLILEVLSIPLFAVDNLPFANKIFVEKSFWGMTVFADRKWRFDDDIFIVRNPHKKTQTDYPYTFDNTFIYLQEPSSIDPDIGIYSCRKILYLYDNHKLTLVFEDDTILNLIEQDYKNKIVKNMAKGVVVTVGIAANIQSQIEAKRIITQKEALAAVTLATNEARGLQANAVNQTVNATYYQDKLARPSEVIGKVVLGDSARDSNKTRIVGKLVNNTGDDGGHLLADSLGGSSDYFNLVPMNSTLNRGAFNKLESRLKDLAVGGHDVDINVKAIYPDNGNRPIEFIYKYMVDGDGD